MKRVKVVDALASTDFGKQINVKGWVRTHRSSKAVDFIALNDGSTIKNIQIVVDPTKVDADKFEGNVESGKASITNKFNQNVLMINKRAKVRIIDGFDVDQIGRAHV